MHKGIGLKRLKGSFWEIRKGLKARVLFKWEGDLVEFILAEAMFSIFAHSPGV